MADTMRWRYGDTNPVVIPVDSTTVIEIGDLVYLNTDDARGGAALTWNTNLATTQEDFHDLFLGVAMQRSRDGDTDSVRIATTGVFEFACASATFEVGSLVGPDDNAGGTALEDQQVIAVATENLAVGRVAKRVASADTKVLVDVVATVSHGGPQVMA